MSGLEALLLGDLHDTVSTRRVRAHNAWLLNQADYFARRSRVSGLRAHMSSALCLHVRRPRFSPRARWERAAAHPRLLPFAAQGVYDLAADLGIVQHGQLPDGSHGERGGGAPTLRCTCHSPSATQLASRRVTFAETGPCRLACQCY
jgi:hypothetical protein